jgi:5-methylcytosine-specific restriction endonuclease McrA
LLYIFPLGQWPSVGNSKAGSSGLPKEEQWDIRSTYQGLKSEQRDQLKHRLRDRQNGRCFICDEIIDLVLQKGQLDIDHIDPLIKDGLDSENNFALTHASCNRSKGLRTLRLRGDSQSSRSYKRRRSNKVSAAPISAICWTSMAGKGPASPSPRSWSSGIVVQRS